MDLFVIKNEQALANLTSLASQYAPFFFAVLYVVFLPIISQTYFRRSLESRVKSDQERAISFETYRFYFISSIKFGIFLTCVAIGWYFFYQIYFIGSKSNTNENINVMEGRILGLETSDILITFKNDIYTVYLYPEQNTKPLVVDYAIISKKPIVEIKRVDYYYINSNVLNALAGGNQGVGGQYVPVTSCVDLSHPIQYFHYDKNSGPGFIQNCN